MFRRAFLSALSAIPRILLLPDRFQPEYPPKLPSEGSFMFWFHLIQFLRLASDGVYDAADMPGQ